MLRVGDGSGIQCQAGGTYAIGAVSEEQLSALLAKLKNDAGLREMLQGAGDLDAAVALAKESGFDVSKADWLGYQSKQTVQLSDEELEGVAGGKNTPDSWDARCPAPATCSVD